MELWCFVTLAFHCMHVPEGNIEQKAIIFSDGDSLRMNVRLEYLPYEYDTFTITLSKSSENIFFTSSYFNGKSTIVIEQPLLSKYSDAVVRIDLGSTNGKGSLVRDFARLIYSPSSEMSSVCTKKRCAIDLAWLKSYPPPDDESTYRYKAASIKKQQHVVSFKDQDKLTLALGLKNSPNSTNYVKLIFTHAKEHNSQRYITGLNSDQKLVLDETFDQVYLNIQLCMDRLCDLSYTIPVIYLQYNESRTDENCLATRCNIILDFGDEDPHESSNDESVAGSVVNNEVADTHPKWTWLIVVTIGAAAFVLALGVVMMLRRRSKRGQNNEDEGIYATAQVTYAVLDLPPDSDRGLLIKEESTPYAVIAGALTPVMAYNK